MDVLDSFTNPTLIATILAGICAFATVLTIAMPILARDRMSRKIDGGLKPDAATLLTMLEAYASAWAAADTVNLGVGVGATPALFDHPPAARLQGQRAELLGWRRAVQFLDHAQGVAVRVE